MARTQRSIDRAHDRKMEKVQRFAHSAAGPSFESTMEAKLFDACWRYLDHRSEYGPNDTEVRLARGVVRGIATGYMLWIQWYQNTGRGRIIKSKEDQLEYVRRLEKRWMLRARNVKKTDYFDKTPPNRTSEDGTSAKW